MPDVVGATAAGRRAAESRMTSRTDIYRAGGTTPDPNGFIVDGWTLVLSDVPFRLSPPGPGGGSRTVRVGDSEVEVAVRIGHWPSSTEGLRDGDVAEITAGENAGRFVRIVEATGADQQTALRLPVVEVDKPVGWPS